MTTYRTLLCEVIMMTNITGSQNIVYIDAPATEIWPYLSTVDGWNHFLSDVTITSGGREFHCGDQVQITIGELNNYAVCMECNPYQLIAFDEHYSVVLPNGGLWEYQLQTTFSLEQVLSTTKVTVSVEGYTKDEMMQWVRECGETGWRQSLFHLKTVIELGLDLRNSIFNYPRLGVLNYTATKEQLQASGLVQLGIRGNYIKTVYPNSPAQRAGLQDGIIITQIGGMPVPTYNDLVKALSSYYGKNCSVTVNYYLLDQPIETQVHLTYDDQFTGMIDPQHMTVDELVHQRIHKSSS